MTYSTSTLLEDANMMVSEAHFVSAEAMKNFSWMIDLIEHPKGLGIYPEIDLEDVGSPEAKI